MQNERANFMRSWSRRRSRETGESWERSRFASGEKKEDFRRGVSREEEGNFEGNGFGRKPQTAARRWKRAYESGDSHLTRETMGNDREDDEEEARFAAGLKVPRCVTRLSGAELMPPSE